MAKKLMCACMILGLTAALLVGCGSNKAQPFPDVQPADVSFEPIAVDTNPPYPMLYIVSEGYSGGYGLARKGVTIVNEQWKTVAQSGAGTAHYICDVDELPGTKEYVRYVVIEEQEMLKNPDDSSRLLRQSRNTVYDMSGARDAALSEFGYLGDVIMNHCMIVGVYGDIVGFGFGGYDYCLVKYGLYDLDKKEFSIEAIYEEVQILGPGLVLATNELRQTLMNFAGQTIKTLTDVRAIRYVDGVLLMDTAAGAGIMSVTGNWIVPPEYEFNVDVATAFCDGRILAIRQADGALVFLGKDGSVQKAALDRTFGSAYSGRTYPDFYVIMTVTEEYVVEKYAVLRDRTTVLPLGDIQIEAAGGIYFLVDYTNDVQVFDPAGTIMPGPEGCVYFFGLNNAETLLRFYQRNDTYRYFQVENGTLAAVNIADITGMTPDGRFYEVGSSMAIGFKDLQGSWVYKTYCFYTLDD